MFCTLEQAKWIFEIEMGENTVHYWCWDHLPTDRELVVLKQLAQKEYGDVSLRGVVYSWGRAGIAADIRYTFGTP